MIFHAASVGKVAGVDAFQLVSNGTGMCVGMREYVQDYIPMLVECVNNHTAGPWKMHSTQKQTTTTSLNAH